MPAHSPASASDEPNSSLYCEGHTVPGLKGSWVELLFKRPPGPLSVHGRRTFYLVISESTAASQCSPLPVLRPGRQVEPQYLTSKLSSPGLSPHNLRRAQIMSQQPSGLLPTYPLSLSRHAGIPFLPALSVHLGLFNLKHTFKVLG